MQYQTFPLVELCFPLISNVVIFDCNKYKCVCFFQDHLTFSNFKTLFVCVRAHITNAKTFTKLHTKMLHFSVKRPKNLLLLTCYFSIIDTVLQLLFIFWNRFDFYNFCFYFHFKVLVILLCVFAIVFIKFQFLVLVVCFSFLVILIILLQIRENEKCCLGK